MTTGKRESSFRVCNSLANGLAFGRINQADKSGFDSLLLLVDDLSCYSLGFLLDGADAERLNVWFMLLLTNNNVVLFADIGQR